MTEVVPSVQGGSSQQCWRCPGAGHWPPLGLSPRLCPTRGCSESRWAPGGDLASRPSWSSTPERASEAGGGAVLWGLSCCVSAVGEGVF